MVVLEAEIQHTKLASAQSVCQEPQSFLTTHLSRHYTKEIRKYHHTTCLLSYREFHQKEYS
jgi:hypothetical protein